MQSKFRTLPGDTDLPQDAEGERIDEIPIPDYVMRDFGSEEEQRESENRR